MHNYAIKEEMEVRPVGRALVSVRQFPDEQRLYREIFVFLVFKTVTGHKIDRYHVPFRAPFPYLQEQGSCSVTAGN